MDTPTTAPAPGIYSDIDEETYHADVATLSCSGAKKLLDCPAKFVYDRVNPPEPKKVFDFGHAAHREVLGAGLPIDVLDFDNFRTKAAQNAEDESRLYGRVPLLRKDWEIVQAMAAEIRRHPIAAKLLDAEHGKAEQSMYWRDERSGLTLRLRVDWLTELTSKGRHIQINYKTAASADPRAFARSVVNFGYHQAAAWYTDGVAAVLGWDDPAHLFIVQEKDPPYVVTVCQLDPLLIAMGAERNRRAIDLYVECSRTGVWPAYATEIVEIKAPRWATYDHAEDFGNDPGEAF